MIAFRHLGRRNPSQGNKQQHLPHHSRAGHFSTLEKPTAFNRILRRFPDEMSRGAGIMDMGMPSSVKLMSNGIIALPQAVRAHLMAPDLETDTTAIELMASTADGWPTLAHISVGELLLGSDELLRMALWRESRTCAALTEAGRGALIFTGGDQLLEVRCLVLAQAPFNRKALPLTPTVQYSPSLRKIPFCAAGTLCKAPLARSKPTRVLRVVSAMKLFP